MRNSFGRTAALLAAFMYVLSFSGCGKAEPNITLAAITPSPEQTIDSAKLAGDWYGYWSVSDTTGDWKSLEEECWDCCAEVLDEEDGFSLLLWDEDMPKDDHIAKLRLKEEAGRCKCTGGNFLDVPVKQEAVILQLLDRDGPLLQISGQYKDTVTGGFSYTVFLRPWGDTWPDDRRKPDHYESWYLPEIKTAGSAPDKIEVESRPSV